MSHSRTTNVTFPEPALTDTLFLLKAAFPDTKLDDRLYHCPSCMRMEGVLACYPTLRENLEVVHVDFARPRAPIVALLGEAAQSCPVLVLGNLAAGDGVQTAPTGRSYISGADAISAYLAETRGIPAVHP